METSRSTQSRANMGTGEYLAGTPRPNVAERYYNPPATTVALAGEISGGSLAPAPAIDQVYRPHRPSATLAREIAGIRVEPFEIDEIFALWVITVSLEVR